MTKPFVFRMRASSVLTTLALCTMAAGSWAFTQSGAGTAISNGIPMGHEWVTRLSALELLGGDPVVTPDPADPRKSWSRGKAKNTNVSDPATQAEIKRVMQQAYADQRYQSTYKVVYDAIMGERWVDIGGFNVAASTLSGSTTTYNCHDAVTQEPAEIQYDHFMRRYDDRDGLGGVNAAKRSKERFIQYFVNAAMAPKTQMVIWDGGGYSAQTKVDRNYFLFGRAVHMFEDSFSDEHTVRVPADGYEQVRQVKSYLCSAGSEGHVHAITEVLNYQSGDVIWNPGSQLDSTWAGYKPSNMKPLSLVATEAMKDMWAAFFRTMGTPMDARLAVARAEAQKLADNWLAINEAEMQAWYNDPAHRDSTYILSAGQSGPGQTVSACMQGLGVASGSQADKVKELETAQKVCLFNIQPETGYSDLHDPSLRMPYNWKWVNPSALNQPPAGWTIPVRAADTGVRVKIKSALNSKYMTAPSGVANNSWVYNAANSSPALEFIQVGDVSNAYYRSVEGPLFLSYSSVAGAVKLSSLPLGANFKVEPIGDGSAAIKSLYSSKYMYLYNESPYISTSAKPANLDAHWVVEPIKP